MSHKRARSSSPQKPALTSAIFRSEKIEDRSSTFIGVYSPSTAPKALQALPEFITASHRIVAWRTPSKQRTLSTSQPALMNLGHDDDGESYAGKKLERILIDTKAEGSIVVARWYGGVLLGPVRFDHIERCAREAISKWRISTQQHAEGISAKKLRIEENDEELKSKLIHTLEQRDQSIIVLRALLAERIQDSKPGTDKEVTDTTTQPSPKKPEYVAMPLQVLKQLEKARDNSISWVLKEIDNVEKQLESSKEANLADQSSLGESIPNSSKAPPSSLSGSRDRLS